MTLATHIAIAAAVAGPLAGIHPAIAFFAAVATHYAADAIPHWDYRLFSMSDRTDTRNKKWVFTRTTLKKDILRTTLDGMLGITLILVFAPPISFSGLLTSGLIVVGAILPDFLQGIYYTKKADFLKPVKNFHDYVHSKINLSPYPLLGIPFQIIILFISILFL